MAEDSRLTIRRACTGDCARVADLSLQLGYPATPEEVRGRLALILGDGRHAFYMAERADGEILGFVHVYVTSLVVVERQAEIGGLVVDETHRGRSVGRLLMEEAERWARANGCKAVVVRSNVVREGAHAFYRGLGYAPMKTQLVFRKAL